MSIKRKYELIDHPKVDYAQCVRVRKGRYKGLVYHYGRVGFPMLPDGRVKMEFNFTVVENPRDVDLDEKMLHKLLGDILVQLLDEELSRNEGTISEMSVQEIEEVYQKEVETDAGIDRGIDSAESDLQ